MNIVIEITWLKQHHSEIISFIENGFKTNFMTVRKFTVKHAILILLL